MIRKSLSSLLAVLALAFVVPLAEAASVDSLQPSRWAFGAHVGLNLGGALPPSVPDPVDRVRFFNPGGAPVAGLDLMWRFSRTSPFGLQIGAEYEGKSFTATVDATEMPISYANESHTRSLYSGMQRVDMRMRYLTIPVGVTFDLPRSAFRFYVGGYYSHVLEKSFRAQLDGNGTMNGQTYQPNTVLSFNLTEQLVRNDVGVRFGADYRFSPHWYALARMNVGLPKIFDKSFEVMPYSLRQVFMQLGVGYRL